MTPPDFSRAISRSFPFPHVRIAELLTKATADPLLDWLDGRAPWRLRVASFYEQHEFSMLRCRIPAEVAHVVSDEFVGAIARQLADRFGSPLLELVDVAAHRLVAGQTIRLHNDDVGETETHRLVVHLNRGWSAEQGGLLMIFEKDDPATLADVLLPAHRAAFAFEISERSHHAVSTIREGRRHTLVYTFRKAA